MSMIYLTHVTVTRAGPEPSLEFGIPETLEPAFLRLDGVDVDQTDVEKLKQAIGILAERIETLELRICEEIGEYGSEADSALMPPSDVDLRRVYAEYADPVANRRIASENGAGT